jgi:glycosyltransferase involved in cell wall biosynthesis
MALALRDEIAKFADSEIYANWIHSDYLRTRVKPLKDLPPSEEVSLLVYHVSIGRKEVHEVLAKRTEPLGIIYHNVTPAHYYEHENPEFAADLQLGRREVTLLRERVRIAIADSQYNARELESMGYSDVVVSPAGLRPSRLTSQPYNSDLVRSLEAQYPEGYVVVVGQVLPHKRVEQAIETLHLYNSTFHRNVGLVICGAARQIGYWRALGAQMRTSPFVGIRATGPVDDRDLATYMRCSRLLLGMSDHEGLCIPPLEAMSLGVPVVIKGACAVPDTVGDGALVLPTNAGPEIASEAINLVLSDDGFRGRLIQRGYEHVSQVMANQDMGEAVRRLVEAAQ